MLKGASGAELIESIRQRGELRLPLLQIALRGVAVHCHAKPYGFSACAARQERRP